MIRKKVCFVKAENLCRLILAIGDGFDAAAVNFGKISGVVQGERHLRRDYPVKLDSKQRL